MSRRVVRTAAALCLALGVSSTLSSVATAQRYEPACPRDVAFQPFLPWADPIYYLLVPGGDFEAKRKTWTLTGGAKLVPGNEPFQVNGPRDLRSLALPSGATATTPEVCVETDQGILRFFVRRSSGPETAVLTVEALYIDTLGRQSSVQIGTFANPRGEWTPSPQLPVFVNAPLVRADASTMVNFRFVPELGSKWQVDDVFLDPWRRN